MVQYFPIVTGSLTVTGSVNVSGSITTNSTITATTLVVQTITSSVSAVTGSTNFGSLVSNTHTFTGSMNVTGALAVTTTGIEFQVTNTGVNLGNALTDSHIISGSVRINPNGLFVSSSGVVGIGTSTVTEGTQAAGSISIIPVSSVSSAPLIQFPGNGRIRPASTGDRLSIDGNALFLNSFIGGNIIMATGGGNVGIGTSSPSQKLDIRDAFQDYSSGAFNQVIYSTTSYSAGFGGSIGLGGVFTGTSLVTFGAIAGLKENGTDNNTAGYLSFLSRANGGAITEKMRLNSSGVLLIGTTSTPSGALVDAGTLFVNSNLFIGNTSGTTGYAFRWDGFQNTIYGVWSNASGGDVGGVQLAYGSTSWSPFSSDVRTKKNFETTQGLNEVLNIEPIKYHLLNDDDNSVKRLGFKAQNLQMLIPEMVHETGRKLEDGSNILTITPDYLLPVLVKAIQEQNTLITNLRTEIEELTARVQELENK